MKLLILSDIHGNLNALKAVLKRAGDYSPEACILLGDLIDYGMRSNEVIAAISSLSLPVICNIYGNHERAIVDDEYSRFSSDRGRVSARHTRSQLNADSWNYIKNVMEPCGVKAFFVDGKNLLVTHGSLGDEYWKSISFSDDLSGYEQYDFVLSGHSHIPHCFERYYKVDNPATRNKKKTVFINPGSVGQPRNLSSAAQFAVLDTATEEISFVKVGYDVEEEQSYFDGSVDEFYKDRLKKGV